jgi:hypothetical protein
MQGQDVPLISMLDGEVFGGNKSKLVKSGDKIVAI